MSGSPLKRFSVWSSVEVSEATEATEYDRQNASRDGTSTSDRLPYRYLSPQSRQMWTKWQSLEKEAVVRESVMNRNVMLGQAFFIKALGHSQSECEVYFDRIITQWVNDYIKVGDVDVAEDILSKAGYNPTEKMKEMCLNTSDVIARDYLFDYLTKKNAVDDDETDAWKFLRLIESALSSINYYKPNSSGSSSYDCRHTNLPISLVMSNFPNWQNVVWADIFLNTHVNNYDSFVKPEIAWKLLICRHDVSTISRWVSDVNGQRKTLKQEVNNSENSFNKESVVSKELSGERAITFAISQDMVDAIALEDAIPEVKDEILDCLCQHGINSRSEVGWKMFRRFSRAGLLPYMIDCWMNVHRSDVHSNASMTALKELASICIDNSFPEVLSICLPHHGNSVGDVIEYFERPPVASGALDGRSERGLWGVDVPLTSWADIRARLDQYPPKLWPLIFSLQRANCHVSVHDLVLGQLPELHNLFGGHHLTGEGFCQLSQLQSSSSGGEAQIDFLYYLRQARPTYAACAFLVEQLSKYGSIQSDSVTRACGLAQGLAMSSSPFSMVGTACATFVAMIGGSADVIRLYLAAGQMCSAYARCGKNFQENLVKAQTSDECFGQLLSALESAKQAFTVQDEYLGLIFKYAVNISLARVCGQTLPEALPRFFAQNDLWLQFILCVQLYRYPPEQVINLVGCFKSNCLREHLWHAVQLVEPEGCYRKAVYYSRIGIKADRALEHAGKEQMTHNESFSRPGDIAKSSGPLCRGNDSIDGGASLYTMLLRHHSRVEPPQRLPLTTTPPNPTLAVLETCVEGNSNLECLCKWLIGTCWNFGLYESWKVRKADVSKKCAMIAEGLVENQGLANLELDEIVSEEEGDNNEKWSHEDAILLFQEVIHLGYFSLLSKGFYIFLPDSPLHPFTKSLAFAVEEMDFQKSLINLHYFKSQLTDLCHRELQSHSHLGKISKDAIWDSKTLVQISHSMILTALSKNINAPQQRLNLLGIFRQANLVEITSEGVADLDVLYGLQECLCKTGPEDLGVELDFSCLPPLVPTHPLESWSKNLKECLLQLIQKNHFSIALQFAEIAGLPKDPVLIAEWKKTLEKYSADLSEQHNPLHKDLNSTLSVSPVEACNCAFVTHGISPDAAARFFNAMASSMTSMKERYKMLKLALHWLGKANKVQFNLGPPEGSDALSLEIEEVELNMWKCRLELQMDEGVIADIPEGLSCFPSLRMSADKIRRRAEIRVEQLSDTPSALGSLIGLHLDVGDVATAIRLESAFSFADRDVSLLLTCMALAEGDMYPADAEQIVIASEAGMTSMMPFQPSRLFRPGSLQSLSPVSLKSHFMRRTTLPEDLSEMTQEETDANCKMLAILERIVNQLQRGKMLGLRIVTCFRLAFYLNIPYLEILNLANPIEALCHHLRDVEESDWTHMSAEERKDEVKRKLTLASDILLAARLDRVGKAEFLQHEIVAAIQEFEDPGNTRSLSGKVLMWGLSLDDNFPAILDLCEDDLTCSLLGDSLLQVANHEVSSSQPLSHRKVVEFLIRAHDCHSRACNMEGISRILRQARILTSSLLAAEEWSLMVRLLTGIKRYTEMNYILLILKEHKQFEYVLGKGMDKVPGLKVALLDFLRRHCPGDKEYLWLVVLHFRLHSETAELWLSEAETVINSISMCSQTSDPTPLQPSDKNSDVKLPVIQCSDKIMSDLKLAIQNYTHAAEFYLQANQPIAASRCAHKAELAALQIYLMDQSKDGATHCILHLEPLQIAAMVTNILSFPQAWILVRAYGVAGNWAAAIYSHYVQGGDSTYLANFMRCKAITTTIVEDIARRFLLDDGNADQEMSQRMANLLTEMNDIEVCYRLSSRLGLWALTGQLLTSPHLPYLRDVVWVGGTSTSSTR
ncbi:spatacsin isoform X2 [Ischnura elegans]|uniref:spatacsin isoform X2 n=1 Tax=Ischnura elegans TaxID=197161 RepID=UPI001ED87467|nr:spatacsin isoform X2 [Ischnura elegans]